VRRRLDDDDELENQLNRGALWAVTYGDVMSYLMIFFLMMFVFTYSKKSANSAAALKAIQEHFGSKVVKTTPAEVAKPVQQLVEKTGEQPPPEEKKPTEPPPLRDELSKQMGGIAQVAKMEVAEDAVRLTFSAPVLFDTGSAALKPSAIAILKPLAENFTAIPNPIHIEGHTDNVPPGIHSQFKSNWELSAARAFAVLRYFEEQGIPPERLAAIGYGEYAPSASNDTPEGRAKNRRIQMQIIRKKAAQ
jgi:chemotaxis protein MotB